MISWPVGLQGYALRPASPRRPVPTRSDRDGDEATDALVPCVGAQLQTLLKRQAEFAGWIDDAELRWFEISEQLEAMQAD